MPGKNEQAEANGVEGDENGERVPEAAFEPMLVHFFPSGEYVKRGEQRRHV